MLLQLSILLAVAFFHLVDFSNASPARQLNLDPPPDSLTATPTLPSLNVSKTLNGSLAGTTFLAHRFRVPNTHTVLGLGFGIIRHRIDAVDLQSLLHLALSVAKEGLDHYGGDAEYPFQPGALHPGAIRQSFGQIGFDLSLLIQDCGNYNYFNYGELYESLEGLMAYLVVGQRSWETTFMVWNGPGRFPDLTDPPIARGKIRMMKRSSGVGVE
ncbi:MAG: hypothetical protein HETSPECPRED_003218 [Heterodermia speciosa]|uniref:Uncharacterized protein n=1 Tax=Heterodermia speciosa TaxID=116794 RepID=A0A8H3PIX6_9LECA|nr:MAG: hypothetical protein HETSPECPRED_003218 [Heterodermia speciosa]